VSPLDRFESSLRTMQRVLGDEGVPYHLTGGAATIAYSEPRMTVDLDYVVDRARLAACLPSFLKSIADAGYGFTEQTVHEAVAAGRQFQLFHAATAAKLDFYPRELVPGELARSTILELLPGVDLPVVSRSDFAIAKLIWISKGSHKSRRDLRQMMSRATLQDQATIRKMASEQGLLPLLEEVLAESDEVIE
jgi:hypothetical protein